MPYFLNIHLKTSHNLCFLVVPDFFSADFPAIPPATLYSCYFKALLFYLLLSLKIYHCFQNTFTLRICYLTVFSEIVKYYVISSSVVFTLNFFLIPRCFSSTFCKYTLIILPWYFKSLVLFRIEYCLNTKLKFVLQNILSQL